jgi:hypothetical protein
MKHIIMGFLVLVGSIFFGCASSLQSDWTSAKTACSLVMSQRSVILRKAPILLVMFPQSDPSVIIPLEIRLKSDFVCMEMLNSTCVHFKGRKWFCVSAVAVSCHPS